MSINATFRHLHEMAQKEPEVESEEISEAETERPDSLASMLFMMKKYLMMVWSTKLMIAALSSRKPKRKVMPLRR